MYGAIFAVSLNLLFFQAIADGEYLSHVHLEWPEALNARRYQVQVNVDPEFKEKNAHDLNVEARQVTTQLPVGKYYMRVRHLDLFGRISPWSKNYEVMVKAPPPVAVTPTAKAKLTVPNLMTNFYLRWKPVAGCKDYLVHVYRDGREIFRARTAKHEHPVQKLESGEYGWNVGCVFTQRVNIGDVGGRSIASEKEYEGGRSDPYSFNLKVIDDQPILPGAKLLSPKGLVLHRPEPIVFAWEPLEKTSDSEDYVYHFHLYKKPEEENLENSSGVLWEHIVSKRDVPPNYNRYLASKLPPGKYKWEVESQKKTKTNISGEVRRSEQEFQVALPIENRGGTGFLAVGGTGLALNYTGKTASFMTNFAIQMFGPTAFGEYWFTRSFGADLGYSHNLASVQGTLIQYQEAAGGAHYRKSFLRDFMVDVRLGLGWYSIPEIVASAIDQVQFRKVNRISLLPQAKLAYWFNDNSHVYFSTLYNYMLRLTGGAGDGGTLKSKRTSSYKISLGGRSFLLFPWGIGGEGSYAIDRYAYETSSGEIRAELPYWEFRVFLMYGF